MRRIGTRRVHKTVRCILDIEKWLQTTSQTKMAANNSTDLPEVFNVYYCGCDRLLGFCCCVFFILLCYTFDYYEVLLCIVSYLSYLLSM